MNPSNLVQQCGKLGDLKNTPLVKWNTSDGPRTGFDPKEVTCHHDLVQGAALVMAVLVNITPHEVVRYIMVYLPCLPKWNWSYFNQQLRDF